MMPPEAGVILRLLPYRTEKPGITELSYRDAQSKR
jgi:hypothetical protein